MRNDAVCRLESKGAANREGESEQRDKGREEAALVRTESGTFEQMQLDCNSEASLTRSSA